MQRLTSVTAGYLSRSPCGVGWRAADLHQCGRNMPTEVTINIPSEELSDDEVHLKAKMIKLDQSNWVQWSCQMENYLTARLYNNLLMQPSEIQKQNAKFKQKNSSALSLLWECISTELEEVILDNRTPFTLSSVVNRVAIENSQRQQSSEHTLFINPSNQTPRHNPKGKGQKMVKKNEKNQSVPQANNKTDSDKSFENLGNMISKLQASMKNQSEHMITEPEKALSSDLDIFVIQKDTIFSIDKGNKIYLDSGEGKSVVNRLNLLTKITPVQQKINIYGNSVAITHQGTLTFKSITIHPVYFAPNGPISLLLVSQLLNHGIKPIIKDNVFLLKKENYILASFKQEENLFASKIQSENNYMTNTEVKDWHTILGHPSDSYLKHLLEEGKTKGELGPSKDFQSFQKAQIQNHPCNRALPSSTAAFHCLHTDTLEITPATE
ncbi:hypothetical protein O181_018436 [Austropuccinia psidii MF-1]|uniref:Uncharacterized protein n=1 Tax=Austropuccinia psidii MF-1 TaxID=1389203 RepID=A0A9Q3GSY5_9BASI|nr:hypothetical protein [Austropuccinia psidii MF-1]